MSSHENKGQDNNDFINLILKSLEGSGNGCSMKVKSLRKLVLLSLQFAEDDKVGKKRFKKNIQNLESDQRIILSADGIVTLSKKDYNFKSKNKKIQNGDVDGSNENIRDLNNKKASKKRKDQKDILNKKKKARKGQSVLDLAIDSKLSERNADDGSENEQSNVVEVYPTVSKSSSGGTRLFIGNLPFAVNEQSLAEFVPGEITHIKWITDKETGRFYGSAFVEMKTPFDASSAVDADGSKLMQRAIKIKYAPARPGDMWPPPTKVVKGGEERRKMTTGGSAGAAGIKTLDVQPSGCMKLFVGNLSYEIDDDGIFKFFANGADAEVKTVRWIHHRDTGDFKGVGYVEFWNEEACARAAKLNGKNLLGRPIRIDWTD